MADTLRQPDTQVADVELRDIAKRYGEAAAVERVSLTVAPGELVSLLGPSGCGKTTTLRIVAGFVQPDHGTVLLKNADVTDVPPNKRDVGMLFQNYALFPHLTAADNVAFGLRMRRVPRPERRRRVEQALDLVRLRDFTDRYPRQMSGGQQQRVALARAVVIHPSVLLLDEPLSNLDAKLRQDLRAEIRQLQQTLRITTIFVTHDQEEALTMSDRLVVMNHGRVEQIGSPADIYRAPRTLFVAQFIGETNIIAGRLEPLDTRNTRLVTDTGVAFNAIAEGGISAGMTAMATLRPESLHIFRPDDRRSERYANRVQGVVETASYLGSRTMLSVRIDAATSLRVMQQAGEANQDHGGDVPRQGETVIVACSPEACRVIPTS
ncbi:MAG TPA: ABC transporter ATP-binding protein [Acetobacteraceae bacterium]|jgi:putative spermidine/putrescine transport system ATP-binding protein|nr:ABC transporter ATP-binding protein [Acetobacteraceae bacterium]